MNRGNSTLKRSPLSRGSAGLKRTTKLRTVSKKLTKGLREYYRLRDVWLLENPVCEPKIECNGDVASQVHHKKGRGPYLNRVDTWMAICPACHSFIHENANLAREKGWMEF